ncbi:hypothetical protein OAI25_00755 [Alphaproteobacteria bacterium]|nr:hypothetical protein [Alphaproteobacteria bacterium]
MTKKRTNSPNIDIVEKQLMFKKRQKQNWKQRTTLMLLITSLSACFPERFRHEKYDCSSSPGTIKAIVLSKAEVGNNAKIIGMTGEQEASVEKINTQVAILRFADRQIKVNRESGAITLIYGSKYRRMICEKSLFKM